ncbi:FusB/FusC family EF-G-binding protein, partial [Enterococcus cecorum]
MNQKIYPHQYHALHQQINDLINAYQSVNDLQTIQVYQALIFEKIDELFFDRPTEIEQLKSELLDKRLTKARAQRI